MKHICYLVALFLFCHSCTVEQREPMEEMGMKPIYKNKNQPITIESSIPQEFESLGKIVYVEPYLYINEKLKGIHVVDNTDLSSPEKIAFINILGNIDFTINEHLLYADSGLDLYVIDITDINNVNHIHTVTDIYTETPTEYLVPPDYEGFFECVDESLGQVVSWERALLIDPKCFR